MIDIRVIDSQVKEILDLDTSTLKPREVSKAKKNLQRLYLVRWYLASDPSEDFVLSEIKRLEARLHLIAGNFGFWTKPAGIAVQDEMKVYEKEMGVPLIREQIKCLRLISNS